MGKNLKNTVKRKLSSPGLKILDIRRSLNEIYLMYSVCTGLTQLYLLEEYKVFST